MASPQFPSKDINIAYQGQAYSLDNIPDSKPLPTPDFQSEYEEYDPENEFQLDTDFIDLLKVSQQMLKLRIRMHHLRKEKNDAQRKYVETQWAYNSAKRRTLIGLSGGTEKTREALAEVINEDALSQMLVWKQVVDELSEQLRTIRIDLDALREVSNNVRKEINT